MRAARRGQQRRQAPERLVAQDTFETGKLKSQRLDLEVRPLFRNHGKDYERDGDGNAGKTDKHAAPSDHLDSDFDRHGGGQLPEPAERHDEGIAECPPLRGKPQHHRLEARHQPAGEAEADHCPCQCQHHGAVTDSEQEGAGGAD